MRSLKVARQLDASRMDGISGLLRIPLTTPCPPRLPCYRRTGVSHPTILERIVSRSGGTMGIVPSRHAPLKRHGAAWMPMQPSGLVRAGWAERHVLASRRDAGNWPLTRSETIA